MPARGQTVRPLVREDGLGQNVGDRRGEGHQHVEQRAYQEVGQKQRQQKQEANDEPIAQESHRVLHGIAGLLFKGAVGDDAPLAVLPIPKQAQNASALVFETEKNTVIVSGLRSILTTKIRFRLLPGHLGEREIP